MVNHQIAHIYLNDSSNGPSKRRVKSALEDVSGINIICDVEEKRNYTLITKEAASSSPLQKKIDGLVITTTLVESGSEGEGCDDQNNNNNDNQI